MFLSLIRERIEVRAEDPPLESCPDPPEADNPG